MSDKTSPKPPADSPMRRILNFPLAPDQAGIWFLGQAGYIIRSSGVTVVIDPYLSDSGAGEKNEFTRQVPVPIDPVDLQADVYIVTHDHIDHLDPDTVRPYAHKETTRFIAPRLTAKSLRKVGVPAANIQILGAGESVRLPDLQIDGIFAMPTGADVLDTTGYLMRFSNGRTVYHTSDTAPVPLVHAAAPRNPEVMLVPINGKWGNPNPAEALRLAATVAPRFVVPNHYDMMSLNSENPQTFAWLCAHESWSTQCVIFNILKPFVWK